MIKSFLAAIFSIFLAYPALAGLPPGISPGLVGVTVAPFPVPYSGLPVGTGANTVAAGNDSRITGALPSSAVGTTVAPLSGGVVPPSNLPAASTNTQGAMSLTTAAAQAPVQSVAGLAGTPSATQLAGQLQSQDWSPFTFVPPGASNSLTFGNLLQNVDASAFGVKCNSPVVSGTYSIALGSTALTAAANTWSSANAGNTIILPGAGISGANLVTTIATYNSPTSVTLAAPASTTLSSVAESITFGNDDTYGLASAYAYAASIQGTLTIRAPYQGAGCIDRAGIQLANNTSIVGVNNPTLIASVTGRLLYDATGALNSNWRISGISINGQFGSINNPIQMTGSSNGWIDHIHVYKGGNPILLTGGANNNVLDHIFSNYSQSHAIEITSSYDNTVDTVYLNNQSGFGTVLDGTSHWNTLHNINCDHSGIECVGMTQATYVNSLTDSFTNYTGDNCFSITGSGNTISNNRGQYCQGNGLNLYGSKNRVTNFYSLDNNQGHAGNPAWLAGICICNGFGGTAQDNVVVGTTIIDDQATPTTQYGIATSANLYLPWAASTAVSAGSYRYNGLILYLTSGGGTTGTTAPTCTSGSCSDGSVTWSYVTNFNGSVQPDYNNIVVGGNDIEGMALSPYHESSNATHNSGIRCTNLGTVANTLAANGNQCYGTGGTVAGQNSTSAGTASFAGGSGSSALGTSSVAWGSNANAGASYSDAFGLDSTDRGVINSLVYGSIFNLGVGDTQIEWHVVSGTTSGTSALTLTTNHGAPTNASNAANVILMPTSSAYDISCTVVAHNTAAGGFEEFSISHAMFVTGSGAGSIVAATGNPSWTIGPYTGTSGLITPALVADTAFNSIDVTITASSGTWYSVARCDTVEN